MRLGVPDNTVALTAQPIVTVQLGAALHLLPLTGNITLTNPFSLTGHGITNNFYPLINQEGAIENLAGINTITGNIMLMGPVGVGVEQIYQANDPTSANYSNPLANNVASQLTLSGTQSGGASSSRYSSMAGSRRAISPTGFCRATPALRVWIMASRAPLPGLIPVISPPFWDRSGRTAS